MAGPLAIGGRLVAATHNAHKLAELEAMLTPRGIELIDAGTLGLPEPEETAPTFAGNAAIKAEAAASATGLPALADDSGLVVDALGGEPGVLSARWAGPTKDFDHAMATVLRLLDEAGCAGPDQRAARFVAVLALARSQSETLTFEGTVEGIIASAPRGTGFGYDPIFIPAQGDGRTFGEMSAAEKAGGDAPLSHRARAVASLAASLVVEASS